MKRNSMNLFVPLTILYRIMWGDCAPNDLSHWELMFCIEKGNGLLLVWSYVFYHLLVYVCIIQMIYVKGSAQL